jgi:hypothetical protein
MNTSIEINEDEMKTELLRMCAYMMKYDIKHFIDSNTSNLLELLSMR